jgi:hypothetical protein
MALAGAGGATGEPPGSVCQAHRATPGGTGPLNALASKRVLSVACGKPGTPSNHDREIDDVREAAPDHGALMRGNLSLTRAHLDLPLVAE